MTQHTSTLTTAGGGLFIVATPIGNLADLSPRQRDTLAGADVVAAEDTRHTGQLLSRLNLRVALLSLHEHNETQRVAQLLERLAAGQRVALVSDAGTPLISDPGYRLVQAARAAGHPVVPIPGPCALIAALSVAGLPTDRFAFEGFPPARAGARRRAFESLAAEARTLVFYESVHRLVESLADMQAAFGADRPAALARELTKRHEQVLQAPLGELLQAAGDGRVPLRGECVVVVQGAPDAPREVSAEARRVLELLAARMSGRDAVELAAAITGERRNRLKRLLMGSHDEDGT